MTPAKMEIEMWYKLSAYNGEARYGWTQDAAVVEAAVAQLNKSIEVNLYVAKTLTDANAVADDNSFGAACVEQKSIEELISALGGEPNASDMAAWGISAAQWRQQIESALSTKLQDYQGLLFDDDTRAEDFEDEASDMTPAEFDEAQIDRNEIKNARENNAAALIDGIKSIYNCADADVDAEGDVWIEHPQRGHWLDEDDLARVARALRAGDI